MDIITILVVGGVIILVLGILFLGLMAMGGALASNFWLVIGLLLAIVLGGWVYYTWFKKKTISVGALVEADIIASCLAARDEMLGDLRVRGSKTGNGKNYGAIVGHYATPITGETGGNFEYVEKDGVKTVERKGGKKFKAQQHFVLTKARQGFIANLFSPAYEIFRIFDMEGQEPIHSNWVGDVDITASCFVRYGHYWFCGNQVNSEVVDEVCSLDALRVVANLSLEYGHEIMVRSVNMNPQVEISERKDKKLPFNLLNKPKPNTVEMTQPATTQ